MEWIADDAGIWLPSSMNMVIVVTGQDVPDALASGSLLAALLHPVNS